MFVVQRGDYLQVVTNPEPSVIDPDGFIRTVVSYFIIKDLGLHGSHVIEMREPVKQFAEMATNAEELQALYQAESDRKYGKRKDIAERRAERTQKEVV